MCHNSVAASRNQAVTVDHEMLDLARRSLLSRDIQFASLMKLNAAPVRRQPSSYKVQWSNHSEDEATWEREDHLRKEYPSLFPSTS